MSLLKLPAFCVYPGTVEEPYDFKLSSEERENLKQCTYFSPTQDIILFYMCENEKSCVKESLA